jgi:hypothetical protein
VYWCEAALLARRYLLTHMPDADSVTCFQALPPELDTLQVLNPELQTLPDAGSIVRCTMCLNSHLGGHPPSGCSV